MHYFYTTCVHISLKEFSHVHCKNWAENVFCIALGYKFHNNIYLYVKNTLIWVNSVCSTVFFVVCCLFFVLILNLLWNMNFTILVFHGIFIAQCWSYKNMYMYKCIVLCPGNVVQAFSHGERRGREICKVLKRFWKLQVIIKVICYTRWFAMTNYGAKNAARTML